MTNQNVKRRRKLKRRIKGYFRLILLLLILGIFIEGIIHMTITIVNNIESNISNEDENVSIQIKELDDTISENVVYASDSNIEFVNTIYKPNNMPDEYFNLIIYYSNIYDVDTISILSLITVENELYDCNASYTNTDGSIDMGLCQINSKYYKEFGDKYNINNFDPYNPEHAIKFMVNHIKYLSDYGKQNYNLNDYDSYLFAAGAYNRGIGNEIKYRNMYEYKEKFDSYYKIFSNNTEEM